MNITITDLLDLSHTMAGEYLRQFQYPWQALDGIKDLILSLGASLPSEEYEQVEEHVWVHKTATVAPTAYLGAPCIIGPETEVRHCAFIRGSALVGAHCVVGNSVELKNVILFDNVQTPHYNYVGDSILGYKSHMGAGSITSNVKSDKTLVVVKGETSIETGRKRWGRSWATMWRSAATPFSTRAPSLAAAAASIPPPVSGAWCRRTASTRIRTTLWPEMAEYNLNCLERRTNMGNILERTASAEKPAKA